jgi:SAM-dependent methyltransferase
MQPQPSPGLSSASRRESFPPCPVCEHEAVSVYGPSGKYRLLQCARCEVVYSPVEPAAPEMEQYYSEEYFQGGAVEYADYIGAEPTHRAQARRYLSTIRRYGRLPCAILDVGCAAGFFLDEARQGGCTVVGCDVSAFAADYARTALKLDVLQGDFRKVTLPQRNFDVVTAFNSFEHLPQPRAVADSLAQLVRPGGLLLIETWDYRSLIARALGPRWHQWHPPFVPYYYTYRTLMGLFPAQEWEMLSYARSAKLISLGRALGIVAAGRTPKRLQAPFNRFTGSRLARMHLSYGLGDLMLAVLQRRQ